MPGRRVLRGWITEALSEGVGVWLPFDSAHAEPRRGTAEVGEYRGGIVVPGIACF